MVANYSGDYATFRPEWSKGWAFTDEAACQDEEFLTRTVPNTFRQGGDGNWDHAIQQHLHRPVHAIGQSGGGAAGTWPVAELPGARVTLGYT